MEILLLFKKAFSDKMWKNGKKQRIKTVAELSFFIHESPLPPTSVLWGVSITPGGGEKFEKLRSMHTLKQRGRIFLHFLQITKWCMENNAECTFMIFHLVGAPLLLPARAYSCRRVRNFFLLFF